MVPKGLVPINGTTDVIECECPECGAEPGQCCSTPPEGDDISGTEWCLYVHAARYEFEE